MLFCVSHLVKFNYHNTINSFMHFCYIQDMKSTINHQNTNSHSLNIKLLSLSSFTLNTRKGIFLCLILISIVLCQCKYLILPSIIVLLIEASEIIFNFYWKIDIEILLYKITSSNTMKLSYLCKISVNEIGRTYIWIFSAFFNLYTGKLQK